MASASVSAAASVLSSVPKISGGLLKGKHDFEMSLSGQGMCFLAPAYPRVVAAPLKTVHHKSSQSAVHVRCQKSTSDGLVQEKGGVTVEEGVSALAPSTGEVQSLLLEVCDKTRIAELKLKVGAFQLHMKREVAPKAASLASRPAAPLQEQPPPPPPVVAASAASESTTAAAASAKSAKPNNFTSSILPATVSRTASLFGLLEAAADQGLSFVTSPKVGVFRRARKVKGKTGKALVEEGLTIKEGQVIGYLEQLGTQQPVESQVSGEVVQVLWQDGEAVGYGDPLVSIRPSFPGIVSTAALN